MVEEHCWFNEDKPALVPLANALGLIDHIETTLYFDDEIAQQFDLDGARAALCHLCQQHTDPEERGQVLL